MSKFQVQGLFLLRSRTSRPRRGGAWASWRRGWVTRAPPRSTTWRVYAVAAEEKLDSKKFFQAIYLAFLGDRQGLKVGWFLSSLERDFVLQRLGEAARA